MQRHGVAVEGHWELQHRDGDGKLIGIYTIGNLVVNVGLMMLGGVTFYDVLATPKANWRLGVTGADPVVAPTDTMASHPGWTEVIAYSEAQRVQWDPDAHTNNEVYNTVARQITINADNTTIGGMFLVNDATKNGTVGDLYSCGALDQGNRLLHTSETLGLVLRAQFQAV